MKEFKKKIFKKSARENTPEPPSFVVEPVKGWVAIGFSDLWEYRELMFFLAWRDVKAKYKQTVLGVSWAFIQPFFKMVVFSLIFGGLLKVSSEGKPYPIFSFAALVPWTFFTNSVSSGSESLVSSANLIKKVYFPRLIVPVGAVFLAFVDFVLAFLVLLLLMAYYGIGFTLSALWLPPLMLLTVITAVGFSLWLSAMNVQFRDIRSVAPFLLQSWMYFTPVLYSFAEVPERLRFFYCMNPMTGVVHGFRWALLGSSIQPYESIFISWIVSLAVLISGAYYFRRMEKNFADII